MTPYPSGKKRPDGEPYLYYTCLSAIKDRPHRTCTVRSLPARAFEAAYIESLEQLAADPSLVERCMIEGAAADRREVAQLQKRLGRLQSELADADRRMGRLLAVFEESEVVPEGMKARCCELGEQQAGLRLEIAQVQRELDDLGGEAPTPQEVADLLRGFTDEIRDLPLSEKKARIRSLITRIDYYLTSPSEGPEGAESPDSEGLFRTSALWVITRINAKAPESGDSGALRAIPYNLSAESSGMGFCGSPASRHRRMSLAVGQVVVLGCWEPPSRPAVRPGGRGSESPEARRERFRKLLESGRYRSQSELAAALGCTQPWISRVLRGNV
ncbi:MAG: hypothetical protein BWY88_01281 [Synergistetes bacterium ADurb.Bin520]|nr:MAG: hypothetical protein BWY88_01281 [Synergistetes bacterium ADurb.Bin520]